MTTSRRIWLFRIAAVLLGLSFFVVAELICAALDLGHRADEDPFVGFSKTYPLFVQKEGSQNYQISKSRLRFFAPDEFPAVKAPHTFRIFCLGGSTVQGNPFSKETSFTTWLKLGLNKLAPETNWEVVNCGGISYATYREVPIVKECLAYQPDLFIICTGHNEFLEERTYEQIKHIPVPLQVASDFILHLRLVTLLQHAAAPLTDRFANSSASSKFEMHAEADPLLDYHDGLKAYHRDEIWRAGVIGHFALNLRRMIALARAANVPVILMRPTSNLSDCPPFKSQHADRIPEARLAEWKSLVDRAQSHYRDNLGEAVQWLEQALAIDDQFAGTHYELGKCYETLGLFDSAREEFLEARELDVCPLRILAPMEEAIAEIAHDTGTPYIDAHNLLEQQTSSKILGNSHLADHVHPTIPAHQEIARALLQEMQQQAWIGLNEGWQLKCQVVWDAHFNSLPDLYFLKGKEHLDNLRLWAQGRADGPPIETRQHRNPNGQSRQ